MDTLSVVLTYIVGAFVFYFVATVVLAMKTKQKPEMLFGMNEVGAILIVVWPITLVSAAIALFLYGLTLLAGKIAEPFGP